jgi:hypothetical protein
LFTGVELHVIWTIIFDYLGLHLNQDSMNIQGNKGQVLQVSDPGFSGDVAETLQAVAEGCSRRYRQNDQGYVR